MNLLRNKTQKEKIIIIALTIIFVFALVFLITSKNKQDSLTVYMNNNTVNVWDNEDSDDLNVDLKPYTHNVLKLGFHVPSDWVEKTIENGVIYTHEKSGSSFKMEVSDYTPSINNVSSSTTSTILVEKGYSFINFIRLSANSYQLLYQDKAGVVNDFIETVYWDKDHIVTLTCSFSDVNYKGIISYFDKIISSFKWIYENPIPSGYALYYNPDIGFEIAVPESWVAQVSKTQIQFVNSKTGATVSLSLGSHTKYFDSLTATDMTNMIKGGKSNFMLKDFKTEKTKAYALYTYTTNGKQVVCDHYLITDGKYNYFASVDYYSGTLDSSVATTIADSFKSYN